MGSVAGSGAGVVFVVDGVAEPVKRLDVPVVLDEFGDLGGVGLGGVRLVRLSCATAPMGAPVVSWV